ncbi:MAG: hypothetical protein Q4B54_09920, partial [Coriobacteriales bacterium]|nr:hypothetical protein [Coriobacteriales bacterium]
MYLYDLLSREVGVGKQTMLASVEEVLAADDIMPCDLDCADTRELLEALDEFVRLTVFKRGRVYATVLDQPQWNEVLERLASEAENPEKGNANVGGPKAWKRKKSKKDPRPAKPRPHGRP